MVIGVGYVILLMAHSVKLRWSVSTFVCRFTDVEVMGFNNAKSCFPLQCILFLSSTCSLRHLRTVTSPTFTLELPSLTSLAKDCLLSRYPSSLISNPGYHTFPYMAGVFSWSRIGLAVSQHPSQAPGSAWQRSKSSAA